VGKAEDRVGHEVKYKVIEKQSIDENRVINGLQGDYALYLIRLENVVSAPFGFNNINF